MLFIKAGLDILRVLTNVILYLFNKFSMYSFVEISNTWNNENNQNFQVLTSTTAVSNQLTFL